MPSVQAKLITIKTGKNKLKIHTTKAHKNRCTYHLYLPFKLNRYQSKHETQIKHKKQCTYTL